MTSNAKAGPERARNDETKRVYRITKNSQRTAIPKAMQMGVEWVCEAKIILCKNPNFNIDFDFIKSDI